MRQLRVLLVCRDSERSREARMVGAWSYPVPEFAWDVWCVPKTFQIDLNAYQGEYDLVVHEDTKAWGSFWGDHTRLPVAYKVGDSTLSDDHYRSRVEQCKRSADLILVDWDRLERFEGLGAPVRRFSHCANERLFYPRPEGKSVDVCFHAAVKNCHEREVLREWLGGVCRERGWLYQSGIRVGHEYPKALSAAKVTINLERNATTRAHRVFDALSCRTCLLTSREPEVSGEYRTAGEHYVEFDSVEQIPSMLERLLPGEWGRYAEAGYRLVQEHHTWAIRARQLRATIAEVFPWLN